MLTGGEAEVRQTDAGIEISVPESDRQPIDTIVALELDVPANQIPAVDVPRPVPLSEKAKATASNIYQNEAEFGPDKAVDGSSDTRWATDAGRASGMARTRPGPADDLQARRDLRGVSEPRAEVRTAMARRHGVEDVLHRHDDRRVVVEEF